MVIVIKKKSLINIVKNIRTIYKNIFIIFYCFKVSIDNIQAIYWYMYPFPNISLLVCDTFQYETWIAMNNFIPNSLVQNYA